MVSTVESEKSQRNNSWNWSLLGAFTKPEPTTNQQPSTFKVVQIPWKKHPKKTSLVVEATPLKKYVRSWLQLDISLWQIEAGLGRFWYSRILPLPKLLLVAPDTEEKKKSQSQCKITFFVSLLVPSRFILHSGAIRYFSLFAPAVHSQSCFLIPTFPHQASHQKVHTEHRNHDCSYERIWPEANNSKMGALFNHTS